jgi:hypothetical protein
VNDATRTASDQGVPWSGLAEEHQGLWQVLRAHGAATAPALLGAVARQLAAVGYDDARRIDRALALLVALGWARLVDDRPGRIDSVTRYVAVIPSNQEPPHAPAA